MSDTVDLRNHINDVCSKKLNLSSESEEEKSRLQKISGHNNGSIESISVNFFSSINTPEEKEKIPEDAAYSTRIQEVPTPLADNSENKMVDLKSEHDKAKEKWSNSCIKEHIETPSFEKLEIKNEQGFSEQLIDLNSVLQLREKELGIELSHIIFQYGLQLVKESHGGNSTALGQLIYVVDNITAKNFKNFSFKNFTESKSWIKKKFKSDIKHKFKSIEIIKIQHLETGFHDAEIAARNYFSVLLSTILFSITGKLNFGIINSLINKHLTKNIIPNTYRENLIRTLKALRDKPYLRDKLCQINKPKSLSAPANDVIRTTLGINSQERLTDLDARKAVLTALLSHLRQGEDGSCFATPLAITLLHSQIDRCLDDFSSLIQSSKLTRKVNQSIQDFPFILKMSGGKLEHLLVIDTMGLVINHKNSKVKLSSAPGIIAACQSIGIDSSDEAINEILLKQFRKSNETKLEIPVKTLLQELALHAKNLECNRDNGIGVLYLKAQFAYKAQEINPLLQVWENAIAGMAEPDETGMILSEIIKAIIVPLKNELEKFTPHSPTNKKLLIKLIRTELLERIHLQYDPLISPKEKSRESPPSEGAFVLYDKNHTLHPSRWIRIDNPSGFKKFTSRTLESATNKLNLSAQQLDLAEIKPLSMMLSDICNYASTDSYLLSCLHLYYYRNKEISDPIKNYEMIKYTPWITKSGNDFSKVIQVYLESYTTSNSEIYSPKNAKDLLMKIIEIGMKPKNKDSKRLLYSTFQLTPVRITGSHAFNLTLSHPSLSNAWINANDFPYWLNDKVLLPGKQISETIIKKNTTKNFLNKVIECIYSTEQKPSWKKIFNQIPDEWTIRELREHTLEILEKLEPHHLTHSELCNKIDTVLLDSLPQEIKTKVMDSALYFADTNWADGLQDVYLCFLVNPGTGDFEIFMGNTEGKQLKPLIQEQWIINKTWEFFTEVQRQNNS